ncbi:hypothetical protein WJX74_006124 [Apatococcus lobatus]|uniref:Uncharacterized protein n=1 Tax=Apatococcus lobatus TaxID=904363 RepID=A0AAW1SFW4_9CHLO
MEIFDGLAGDFSGHVVRTVVGPPRRVSAIDVVKTVTNNSQYRRTWKDLLSAYPEVGVHTTYFKFPGQGQRQTPVVDARGIVLIVNLLPGERAAKFRAAGADVLVRYLGGDLSLVDEIRGIRRAQEALPAHDPARIFGEAVEARQQIPFSYEQAVELRDVARAIVATREGVEAASAAVRDFPFAGYREYLALRKEEVDLNERSAGIRERDAATGEREVRTKELDAAVEDRREAKRARVAREGTRGSDGAGDTVSVPEILCKLCAGLADGAAIVRRFHEQRMGQRAYREFKGDCVPGGSRPLRYQKEAEPGMRAVISDWLGLNEGGPSTGGIHRYFQPVAPPAQEEGPDLYD